METWSKEAEARWLTRYQRFLVNHPEEIPNTEKLTEDNGRAFVDNGKSLEWVGRSRKLFSPPVNQPYTNRDSLCPILSDVIEQVAYEKNGHRFHNYSGLGQDGRFLLNAVDSFYNERYKAY